MTRYVHRSRHGPRCRLSRGIRARGKAHNFRPAEARNKVKRSHLHPHRRYPGGVSDAGTRKRGSTRRSRHGKMIQCNPAKSRIPITSTRRKGDGTHQKRKQQGFLQHTDNKIQKKHAIVHYPTANRGTIPCRSGNHACTRVPLKRGPLFSIIAGKQKQNKSTPQIRTS